MSRTRWRDYAWRLLRPAAQQPLLHMALDQVLTDAVGAGTSAPTLRFWEWAAPAVVLGRFQSVRNEVDLAAAERHGVEIVRRISGGGAMFVEPGNQITYSICAPRAMVEGLSFQQAYAEMDHWVLEGLKTLGINAWYEPLNDITSDGGKIGGAAQAWRGDAVLHHVTMSYDMDAEKMLQVLRIGREKMSDKGTTSAIKRVDPLRRQTQMARELIIDHLIATFAERYVLNHDELTTAELEQAEALIESRFATTAWRDAVA
ncbi:MAG TPA: biotin/lipoate A/B protein ligase family protein [Salinisphaeraceae bacterium]|nr:biotin/lipoate A/B protein ligase family protein [Salinisphaeraceae bacterium]